MPPSWAIMVSSAREGGMFRRISSAFTVQKFVNAAAYLPRQCEVTKMKLAKLLYFSDKSHLLTYARPIIGDRYIKMDFGPVPSQAYNLMKHDERALAED